MKYCSSKKKKKDVGFGVNKKLLNTKRLVQNKHFCTYDYKEM